MSPARCALLGLTLAALTWTSFSQEAQPSDGEYTRADLRVRRQILDMLARSYFPGRTGQLLVVPREGDIVTRPDEDSAYMHGSPWDYDISIPLLLVGPIVKRGEYSMSAAQEDVAPTLAAALGIRMPPTATGRVLPILRSDSPQPKAIMLIVMDGMRRDYFERYAALMPTLTDLRKRGAWFARAQLDVLPSNTSVGHSTISTGTVPGVHGVTGNNVYDRIHGRRHDLFSSASPADLMASTLADVWQLTTSGRAIILAQGSIERAAAPLAGHGACQVNGAPVVLATYDQRTGNWATNPECYRLPEYLKGLDAGTLWAGAAEWMQHRIDSPTAVRYSALFPAFEADAMIAMIEHEPVGKDDVADLILLNYKAADFVGHKYGPDSPEMRATLGEMDQHLARMLRTLEAKVGDDYLLAVTADHGMPSEPSSPERRHYAPAIVDLLHARFDPDAKQLVTSYEAENGQIFIDEERLKALGLDLDILARFLESQPFFFAVFTIDEVRSARAREERGHEARIVTP